jgi:hypothetical protein
MGSGEVTTPVMVSGTVGLQKRTYFEMHYAATFDDGRTARVRVTEAGCLRAADLCYAHLWSGWLARFADSQGVGSSASRTWP